MRTTGMIAGAVIIGTLAAVAGDADAVKNCYEKQKKRALRLCPTFSLGEESQPHKGLLTALRSLLFIYSLTEQTVKNKRTGGKKP